MEKTIYEKAVELMNPADIDHHESDLYLRKNEISDALIKEFGYEVGKGLAVELFKDEIEGDMWYDIFAAYTPSEKVEESNMSLEDAMLKVLQESVMSDLYDELPAEEVSEEDEIDTSMVDGLIDDVLVITDPEISTEEYEEVIERAQEIVEGTEEGHIPFDEEYVGKYVLTCPICGTTFVEDSVFEPGATCPICLEVPEAFVVKGKLDTDETIAEQEAENEEVAEEEEPTEEQPVEEPVEEKEELDASEVVKESENKLEESKEVKTESYKVVLHCTDFPGTEEEMKYDDELTARFETLEDARARMEAAAQGEIESLKEDNDEAELFDLTEEDGKIVISKAGLPITEYEIVEEKEEIVEEVITEDIDPRPNETALLNHFENIEPDYKRVTEELLAFMSDDDIAEFVRMYEYKDEEVEEELEESKEIKTESISETEVIELHNKIEDAETIEEIQDIINSISDNDLETECQLAYDQSINDGDELDMVKDFVISTLEDNAVYDYEEETQEFLTEEFDIITKKGNYGLTGDKDGYKIITLNDNKLYRDLGLVSKEQALADFDELDLEESKNDEERLAGLKTQLEIDGDQLAEDEKEAIESEIEEIESKVLVNEDDELVDSIIKDFTEKELDNYNAVVTFECNTMEEYVTKAYELLLDSDWAKEVKETYELDDEKFNDVMSKVYKHWEENK